MSKRRLSVLVVALGLVVLAGCIAVGPLADDDPDPGAEPEPETLFEQAFVHDVALEDVRGERTTEISAGGETYTETATVAERPYVEYRSEILTSAVEAREGEVYASNASTTWWYDATANAASVYEVEEPFSSEAVRADRADQAAAQVEDYELSYEGTETVAGRESYELHAELRNETVERGLSLLVGDTEFVYALETVDPSTRRDVVEQRLWIDAEYGYPLRETVVAETPGGERITYTERFESVEFNVGLDDERFAFDPPANATVVDESGEW